MHEVSDEFKILPDLELAALEHLKTSSLTYNGRNVATLELPFLIGSSSFLQVKRTCIKA